MSLDLIMTETRNVGQIVLNRSQALHALTYEMIVALFDKLSVWQAQDNIDAVIIRANESRAFCAGGDIRALYLNQGNTKAQRGFFYKEYQLNYLLSAYTKPIYCIMDGITMGGGVGLSMHTKRPIATEHFVFAMPETTIGFFPDVGASYLLSRLNNGMGMYLALTGQTISVALAKHIGLIRYAIYKENITNPSSSSIVESLELMTKNDKLAVPDNLSLADNQHISIAMQHFQEDCLSAIFTSLNQDTSEPAQAVLSLLNKKSPFSLCVTFQQMQRAKHLCLSECLQQDYGLACQFLTHPDLYEGIRAQLIDKDKSPKWQHSSVHTVSPEAVDVFFQPHQDYVLTLAS